MGKTLFPESEFLKRRADLAQSMEIEGMRWLIATHPASIFWLTGSLAKSYQSFQCVLFHGAEKSVTFISREAEQYEIEDTALFDTFYAWGPNVGQNPFDVLSDFAVKHDWANTKIGLETPKYYLSIDDHQAVVRALPNVRFKDAMPLIQTLRMCKSALEIEQIKKAAQIADLAMTAGLTALKAGVQECEVAAHILHVALMNGADQFASPINFHAGPSATHSHGRPTQRKLEQGDFGSIEFGVPYNGYPVSIGRQFKIGEMSTTEQNLYSVARDATVRAVDCLKVGAQLDEVFEETNAVFVKDGLEPHRVHTCGYALAPAFPPATGEALQIVPNAKGTVSQGMHFSVCPPLFVRDKNIGVRLVQNTIVGSSAAKVLSNLSDDVTIVE